MNTSRWSLIEREHSSTYEILHSNNSPYIELATEKSGLITHCINRGPASESSKQHICTLGLVDIQVNGFNGVDFNRPGITAEKLDQALIAMLSTGVTRCLPTLISAPADDLISLLRDLDLAVQQSRLGSLMILGYHIEGPFLSPEDGYVGAHPKQAMINASIELIEKLQAVASYPIRLLTVAPEIEGVIQLIGKLSKQGISCALGHSAASTDQIYEASQAGAILSTHLGNGLPHQLNKNENPLMAQLSNDNLYASFIADGLHVPKHLLKAWLRVKTPSKTVLITDATAAAGVVEQSGSYTLGDVEIELCPDGIVRIPNTEYFAGSSAQMDQTIRNVLTWCDVTFLQAIQMSRTNPLHAVNVFNVLPRIGEHTEIIEWNIKPDGPHVSKVHLGQWTLHL